MLSEKMTSLNVAVVESFSMAPPLSALFPVKNPPLIVSVAEEALSMAPPELEALVAGEGRVGDSERAVVRDGTADVGLIARSQCESLTTSVPLLSIAPPNLAHRSRRGSCC